MPILLGQNSGQRPRITTAERSASAPRPKVRQIHFYFSLKINFPQENGITYFNTIVFRWVNTVSARSLYSVLTRVPAHALKALRIAKFKCCV